MDRWGFRNQSKKRGKDDWVVFDEFGWIKCSAPSEMNALKISREHNAHAELVELVKILRNTIGECSLGAPNYELQQRIDAVLARAEGRTE